MIKRNAFGWGIIEVHSYTSIQYIYYNIHIIKKNVEILLSTFYFHFLSIFVEVKHTRRNKHWKNNNIFLLKREWNRSLLVKTKTAINRTLRRTANRPLWLWIEAVLAITKKKKIQYLVKSVENIIVHIDKAIAFLSYD